MARLAKHRKGSAVTQTVSRSAAAAADHASIAFLVLAGALTTFPPVTTDIYLPALPELTRALHGTTAQGQQTLAAYFLGLGTGQLFYGPWADRIGRRPVMLVGAALYLLATLGCWLTPSIDAMIGLRFLQAIGACSGVVISSAIVRDRFGHQESARIFSILMTARGFGPLIAPVAGGIIVTYLGWRAIFAALGVFGAAMLVSVFLGLKETRTAAVAERARLESPVRAYLEVLKNGTILGYVLTNGLNFAGMFAWIAAAPYLIIGVYKAPVLWFGWIFGINAAGFMAASQINRRLLRRLPADRIMTWSALGAALAALVLLADALTGLGGAFGVMIPLFFVVSSLGLVSTNAMAGGLAVDPARAGTVSALFGTAQFALAGLTAAAAGFISNQTALSMAVAIVVCALGATLFPVSRLLRGRA
jgi:DHA1 family bicyclomycin/chloramphenicol resistance-like MFS transporter